MILGWFTHSKIRMTIEYSREVFNSGGTGLFLHLLNRWKGSIYKLVWRDLLVYVSIYTALSLLYRFQLSEEGKLAIRISFQFGFKRVLKYNVYPHCNANALKKNLRKKMGMLVETTVVKFVIKILNVSPT